MRKKQGFQSLSYFNLCYYKVDKKLRKLVLCQASMLNHDLLNFSVGHGLVSKYNIEIHTPFERH